PPSNAYLTESDLKKPEVTYPLKLYVCSNCWLVQTEDYARADELFSADYAYFSSVSNSWLEHAKKYAEMIIQRLQLDTNKHVVEIAA
ncbi:MAG: SAM-dependent methyltransferase, partial [Gammaproteobacteria bacterium]|nr:SAM-dependent methyltransferase [Gammaproteobacteria bacterium]NIO63597.1 SAM-dependent methyltransferase [Gammaproteobacteria bacterium]